MAMLFQRQPLRILLVEDHPIVGAGLSFELGKLPDFQVVGLFDNPTDVLTELAQRPADVVLSDLYLSESETGIKLLLALRGLSINIPVLIMSSDERPANIQRVLAAGASGFIGKSGAVTEFAEGLRWVAQAGHQAEPFVAPEVLRKRLSKLANPHPIHQHDQLQTLTEKEIETLRLFGQGLSPKEIAYSQRRIVTTVYSHLTNARSKLGIAHEVQLRNFAIQHLLNTSEPD